MNQHLQRCLTGLIGTPLLVAFISFTSERVFSLFILLLIQIAVWEYNRLAFGSEGYSSEKCSIVIFATAIAIAAYSCNFAILTAVLTFSLLLSALLFLLQIRAAAIEMSNMGKVVLGFMYMPLLISSFIFMRQAAHGVQWIIFTLALAFSGDIAGLYAGKLFGKRSLQVNLSPGKTVEGTLGVLVGSTLGGMVFQHFFFQELPLMDAAILGFFGGMMGQLGDLFESALKRSADVKDAGHIIPGHGGVMDRLDSVSFIAPLICYYQYLPLK